MADNLEPYHGAWLTLHPQRDAEWLRSKLKEGFDVHHIDGDHSNNDPHNLVLIEHLDHMRLHGSVMSAGRLRMVSKKGLTSVYRVKRGKGRPLSLPDGRIIYLANREQVGHVLARYESDPESWEWSAREGKSLKEAMSE